MSAQVRTNFSTLFYVEQFAKMVFKILGMLLTMGVHPAWSQIVECATSNRWTEVFKRAKVYYYGL